MATAACEHYREGLFGYDHRGIQTIRVFSRRHWLRKGNKPPDEDDKPTKTGEESKPDDDMGHGGARVSLVGTRRPRPWCRCVSPRPTTG